MWMIIWVRMGIRKKMAVKMRMKMRTKTRIKMRRSGHSCYWPEAGASHGAGICTYTWIIACLWMKYTVD